MKNKIVFFGSSLLSAQVLKTLAAEPEFEIVLVVTQDDKPAGRKKELLPTAVAQAANSLNLPLFKPSKLKDPGVSERLKQTAAQLFVVAAYGKIIPQNLLDLPERGAINIHGSLLPKYRGASPIQAALLNGDSETGISLMLMDSQMDHGPVLLEAKVAIDPYQTFVELQQKLADLSSLTIVDAIKKFLAGAFSAVPQEHARATFTKIVTKEDGKIIWNQPASQIYNQYRAYFVWPGVWTTWKNKVLKISKMKESSAMLPEFEQKQPGTVVLGSDAKIYALAGKGAIQLLEVQLEGKKTMPISEFINGQKDFIGSLLS